eukprot:jgi/Botrbrau1/10588/Bobra.0358s0008.2
MGETKLLSICQALLTSYWPQPPQKSAPALRLSKSVAAAQTDEEFRTFLNGSRERTVAVQFSSAWCAHCHEMFPHFHAFSKKFPELRFLVAQLDFMDREAKDIKFTPTYAFYRQGKVVDQFWGSDPQQLQDHIWLHSAD